MSDVWSVTVSRNGEDVLTISSNHLCGRDLSREDEEAIRTAGRHLLAFVGEDTDAFPPPGRDGGEHG